MTRDLGCDPADAANVGLAVLAAERQAGREVPADDVAVQAGDGALARLEQGVDHGLGDRGLAASGQAGEEEHEPATLRRRLVGVDDGRDVVGVRAVRIAVVQGEDRVGAGVRRDHPYAELVVDLGVVVGRQRDGDHGGAGHVPRRDE